MGCTQSSGAKPPPLLAPVASPFHKALLAESEFHRSYLVGRKLGEGSFGEVRLAEHKLTKQPFAVKVLDAELRRNSIALFGRADAVQKKVSHGNALLPAGGHIPHGASQQSQPKEDDHLTKFKSMVQAEVTMLQAVGQHRHCIRLYDYFHEQNMCYIVTELCQGTVLQYLNIAPLTVPQLQSVLKQMTLGVAHVHEMGLVHRDIKPKNFLIGGKDGNTIKLADFGAATRMPQECARFRAIFGTAPYMSPEMIGNEGYDQRTDVWSLGVTFYVMLYGDYPYGQREMSPVKVKSAILLGIQEPPYLQAKGKRALVAQVPEGADDLVRRCLQRAVWRRPDAAKILRHIFFFNVKVQEDLPVPIRRGNSSSELATDATCPESDASTALPALALRSPLRSLHGSGSSVWIATAAALGVSTDTIRSARSSEAEGALCQHGKRRPNG